MRSAINTRLKTPGRTVLTLYASGYVQDDQAASTASMTALTGITVAKGSGTPALTQDYSFVGQSGGPGYPLTPWFTVTDPAATPLGTYRAGGVSLARKAISGGVGLLELLDQRAGDTSPVRDVPSLTPGPFADRLVLLLVTTSGNGGPRATLPGAA